MLRLRDEGIALAEQGQFAEAAARFKGATETLLHGGVLAPVVCSIGYPVCPSVSESSWFAVSTHDLCILLLLCEI